MKKLVYIALFLFVSINSFSQKSEVKPAVELTNVNAYPNPFSNSTKINLYSSSKSSVIFIVQDVLGNIVTSKNVFLKKGSNTIPFYKDKLVSGIYIYSLKTKDNIISKRFVIK